MLIHSLFQRWNFFVLFQSRPSFAPIVESVVIATVKYYQMNYLQQEQTTEHFLLSAKITYQVLMNIP